MAVTNSVADVMSSKVELEVECIDRMYLNVYVPQLQHDTKARGRNLRWSRMTYST